MDGQELAPALEERPGSTLRFYALFFSCMAVAFAMGMVVGYQLRGAYPPPKAAGGALIREALDPDHAPAAERREESRKP